MAIQATRKDLWISIPQQIGYTILSITHPLAKVFEETGRDWTLTEKRVLSLCFILTAVRTIGFISFCALKRSGKEWSYQ